MKIKLFALLLVLAMAGLISASNPNEAKANKDGKTIKVVWLSFGLSHEWFHSLSIFAEEEARSIEKEDGVKFKFTIKDGQRNLQTQLQQFDQLIAQKNADIIYFEPIDQTAMARMVKKVNKITFVCARKPDVRTNEQAFVQPVKAQTGIPEITVGFAAESRDLIANAQVKLKAKKLDMIVANDVSRDDAGFETDTNIVKMIFADGHVEDSPLMTKDEVADLVLDRIKSLKDGNGN